jgi:hypothetical protein
MNDDLLEHLKHALNALQADIVHKAEQVAALQVELASLHSQRDHMEALISAHVPATNEVTTEIQVSEAKPPQETRATPSFDAKTVTLAEWTEDHTHKPKALELILPNGGHKSIRRSWKSLTEEVARYLVDSDQIPAGMCPLTRGDDKQVIIARGKPNPGDHYSSPRDVGKGYWLETHGSANEHWERSCYLIDRCGLSASTFRVRLQ